MSICQNINFFIFPHDCVSFGMSKNSLQIHSQYSCIPNSLSVVRHRLQHCAAVVRNSDAKSNPNDDSDPKLKPKRKTSLKKTKDVEAEPNNALKLPPRKPRRGRRSEAVAVEDFVRGSLEKTFASIQEQNPDVFVKKEKILRNVDGDDDDDIDNDSEIDEEMVIDEDDPSWPVDADVGWGTSASDYFEKYPIKNIVGEDGAEIDWEGEIDDSWVQEINCLEWESFAFHPSPLIVLVFERYNRATDNWKLLKELEKALKVYWNAKDRLPPRVCSQIGYQYRERFSICSESQTVPANTIFTWTQNFVQGKRAENLG
ncbi:thioredoxin-like fold domain-containing protein MRL7, chloroplastic isoform X2 [Beta vulgaris subsp. vulgaris]|uniref:thioredoxin-like fold domain-containing protein MRL7, chloroplastic isoform X2 n=1 Tax=Beta vulgaris subsp. vulgaris TaxID=3555 RepID=UPI0025473B3D|nr:thioredoxin-like fold domain-containing protein MRL7, chloroplastic isoform X2 [Beta vulgaris subsp. vulgaris]